MKILIALLLAGLASAADRLTIRFLDVEGGRATINVAPTGEALLIDAGSNERDAERIQKAMQETGARRIHYFLLTSFHRDNAGGVGPLAKLVPIGSYLDHGASFERYPGFEEVNGAYQAAAAGKRRGVYAGDSISVGAAEVMVLTANGDRMDDSLPGGGQINLLCGSDKHIDVPRSEDTQSVGVLLTFGRFRMLDFGDIPWNQEMDFVCPVNRIGSVDVYVTPQHGAATSGPGTLVHAIRPQVAIVDNGGDRPGAAETFRVLKSSPGLKAIWQLHPSPGAAALNSDPAFIANPDATEGAGLTLTAAPNGEFSITNDRTGKTESYR